MSTNPFLFMTLLIAGKLILNVSNYNQIHIALGGCQVLLHPLSIVRDNLLCPFIMVILWLLRTHLPYSFHCI